MKQAKTAKLIPVRLNGWLCACYEFTNNVVYTIVLFNTFHLAIGHSITHIASFVETCPAVTVGPWISLKAQANDNIVFYFHHTTATEGHVVVLIRCKSSGHKILT